MGDKKMEPEELAEFYSCEGDGNHPRCPIFGWCFDHVFDPDTCEKTWSEYLKAQEAGEV